jgi:hypothetical protein
MFKSKLLKSLEFMGGMNNGKTYFLIILFLETHNESIHYENSFSDVILIFSNE